MKTSAFAPFIFAVASISGILTSYRLVAAGDEHWDPNFGQIGVSEWVFAIDSRGNSVYASGAGAAAAATNVNINVWDGNEWSIIGRAFGDTPLVTDFAFVGGDVYVSGIFSRINDVLASGLARWDGTNWFTVSGFGGLVSSMATDETNLYVGGNFIAPGAASNRFIAQWDGTNWSDLGAGPNGDVTAIASGGRDVYVGGLFTTAGGVAANRIAKWNGTTWSSLGTGSANGVAGSVLAIAVNGSDVYVGGDFDVAGGVAANNIAKWDGVSWSTLGTGITGVDGVVAALVFSDGKLHAGGSFTNAGGVTAISVASWNGTNWMSLGSGVSGGPGTPEVFALAASGADIYAGGPFTSAGQKPSVHVAHWNEQRNFDQPSITLSNPQQSPGGRFQFRVTASGAGAYVIEASTDFSLWTPLLTNSVSPFDFEDAGPLSGSRFYRTRQQ